MKAAGVSNLLLGDSLGDYSRQEREYPSVQAILRRLEVPTLFFQGMFDNQTPAYHALAVQLINRTRWKKKNLRFFFFPGRGHILDPRESYEDLIYRPIDSEVLRTLVGRMKTEFPPASTPQPVRRETDPGAAPE